MKKPFKHAEREGVYFCRPCGVYKYESAFQPTAIAHKRPRCRKCQSKASSKSYAKRRRTVFGRLLFNARRAERSEFTRRMEESDVATIWNAWDGRSSVSGESLVGKEDTVTLTRWRQEEPMSWTNHAIMTRNECRWHRRLRSRSQRKERYDKRTLERVKRVLSESQEYGE